MNMQEIVSDEFSFETSVGKTVWNIELYPKGNWKENEGYMSVYLNKKSQNREELDVKFSIRAVDVNGCEIVDHMNEDQNDDHDPMMKRIFDDEFNSWGYPNFLSQLDSEVTSRTTLTFIVEMVFTGNVKIVGGTGYTGYSNMLTAVDDELSSGIKSSYDAGKYADCIIACADKEFACHKIILSARSRVFDSMFTIDMKEKNQNRIELKDIDGKVVADMLNFIYCGQVQQLRTKAADLLPAADKYELESLRHMCESSLCDDVNTGNVIDLLVLSEMHNCPTLRSCALEFTARHKKEILDHSNWKEKLRTHVEIIADMYELLARK